MKRLDATAATSCKIGLETIHLLETPKALSPHPPSRQAELILEEIRRYLRDGCTIKAANPNGRILEPLPDGKYYGGLIIIGNQSPDL